MGGRKIRALRLCGPPGGDRIGRPTASGPVTCTPAGGARAPKGADTGLFPPPAPVPHPRAGRTPRGAAAPQPPPPRGPPGSPSVGRGRAPASAPLPGAERRRGRRAALVPRCGPRGRGCSASCPLRHVHCLSGGWVLRPALGVRGQGPAHDSMVGGGWGGGISWIAVVGLPRLPPADETAPDDRRSGRRTPDQPRGTQSPGKARQEKHRRATGPDTRFTFPMRARCARRVPGPPHPPHPHPQRHRLGEGT